MICRIFIYCIMFKPALKAHHLFKRNVSYLVQNGKIVIVDEHTGRSMPGRRWSEGIHQAVEAKESVEVQQENQTLASTTFQNYFRLYDTLAGHDRDCGIQKLMSFTKFMSWMWWLYLPIRK